MRLIDADKLILHLNDYALQESPGKTETADDRKISTAVYKTIMGCIGAVETQPTAYDVDKLVEQIQYSATFKGDGWFAAVDDEPVISKEFVIEIVRGGGTE